MPMFSIDEIFSRQVLIGILLGQVLSLFICGTAITSGYLSNNLVHVPTAQSFLNYFLLSICYMTTFAVRKEGKTIVQVCKDRGWKYLILALVDVEANYLIVKAYQYTTVTSVQLLDCMTIPTVLILSKLIFKIRYLWLHFVGVMVCLLGVGLLVLTDVLTKNVHSEGSNLLLGDLLCLGGAILYGISNVGQEAIIRKHSRVEYLGFLGTCSSFINGLQFVIFERKEVASIRFDDYKIVLSLVGFAICLFLLYSLMPVVMARTSATIVNLNLLSADFYALLAGLFIFHYKFHILYFIAFVIILSGLVIYTIRGPKPLVTETIATTVVASQHNSGTSPADEIPTENKLDCIAVCDPKTNSPEGEHLLQTETHTKINVSVEEGAM